MRPLPRLALLLIAAAVAAAGCTIPTEPEPDPPTEPASPPEAAEEPPPDDTEPADDADAAAVLEVTFFDVGQADAALVSAGDTDVLVDAGHWQRPTQVVERLDDHGVADLDLLVLSHWHADHIGGAEAVLTEFTVDDVWVQPATHDSQTYARTVEVLEAADVTVTEPRKGERHDYGPLTVDVVGPGPQADPNDLHDAGVAVRASTGGGSVLFTGDAEAETEARYAAEVPELLDADVLAVGHHGSYTSSTAPLLDAVDPQVAVYSAGRDNEYDHPHDVALNRLVDVGAEVFGTDVHGTVTVTVADGQVQVDPETDQPPMASASTAD